MHVEVGLIDASKSIYVKVMFSYTISKVMSLMVIFYTISKISIFAS